MFKNLLKIFGVFVALFIAILIAIPIDTTTPIQSPNPTPITQAIPIVQEVSTPSPASIPISKTEATSKLISTQQVSKPTPKKIKEETISLEIFYTSSHGNAKYYYCENDSVWKKLSPKYLQKFNSAKSLLEAYPSRYLHQPC